MLRGVSLFETFNDDAIAAVASVLQPQEFEDKERIIVQGDEGHHLYILDAGECVASIKNGPDCEQEVKRYATGDFFGEKALLENSPRAASIIAIGAGKLWRLSREDFEARLGSLTQLKAEAYMSDPRNLISQFYGKGDAEGPAGTLSARGGPNPGSPQSSWFAIYRPCSRDSIAKMLSGVGTGKGLNIKGKSAKKNRLSGFVPFCQISVNEDKKKLETSPPDARTRVFYQSAANRETARAALDSALVELQVQFGKKLKIDKQTVELITMYEPTAYGLDVPEYLLKEVYVMRVDVSPAVGWETGRDSQPAFLDMNFHSLHGGSTPSVVLYQFDAYNAMNPLGLLMAYAEEKVTPVVSDFDTFLVGSKGVVYQAEPPSEQVELMKWALDHTANLLADPNQEGWMGRWLSILKEEAAKGFHPNLPPYGFGDPISYGLIGKIVDEMKSCGAVRHGAECFNFYFPQELDPDFLVVWDELENPPWKTVKEPELRAFLLERAREGYSFPINPVWPVRDPGWLDVLHALQEHEEGVYNLQHWFPPSSGVMERIKTMQAKFPKGFTVATSADDTRDMACAGEHEIVNVIAARWRRIRIAMKMQLLRLDRATMKSDIGIVETDASKMWAFTKMHIKRLQAVRASIFDSPLQEAIGVLRELVETQHDGDAPKRKEMLRYINTLLHAPDVYAMRDEGIASVNENVDPALQEWFSDRHGSLSEMKRGSALHSALSFANAAPTPNGTAAKNEAQLYEGGVMPKWLRPSLVPEGEKRVLAMLETGLDSWTHPGFDALELQRLTNNNALCALGWAFFTRHDWREKLQLSPAQYRAFLTELQGGYQNVPYHNQAHAADVAHATHYLLTAQPGTFGATGTPEMLFAGLVAAMGHDCGHDGRNNGFHVACESEFAILYSDQSPLEHHHLAMIFRYLNQAKLLSSWPLDAKRHVRERIIQMVLGTDFAHNMKIVNTFKLMLDAAPEKVEGAGKEPAPRSRHVAEQRGVPVFSSSTETMSESEQVQLATMVLKLADLGYPSKGLEYSLEWIDRCLAEMCDQGDREKALGLPVNFDRATLDTAKMQVGFFTFMVVPMYETLDALTPMNKQLDAVKALTEHFKQEIAARPPA